jgi:glycosyltransferase involved in cell wall biosynthesis
VTDQYPGRLALQQRVLPAYRAPLFDALAAACVGGLSVFAGQPRPDESIVSADRLQAAQLVRARNLHIGSLASPSYLCWQIGILGWLEDWQPDALIVEANPRNPATRLAVRWMHARQRPVIGWGLGAPPISGPLWSVRRWERLSLLRALDAVVAYSRIGAEEYLSLGIRPDSVFVAPNAVTPPPSAPPPGRSPQFDGPPRLLFVGRLQARKRIDNLLRACAALPAHLQPVLWIVGDGPARQEFQEFAAQVYPQAEFLGARHGAELGSVYAQADLFVLPGTGGLAVQEAMAHGLPVVVAQGDGTQGDLVRPGNGWQIPSDDLESLTAVLRQALSDPGRLRLMGKESYRIVAEEVNTDAMVAVFLRVLKGLCGD